MDVITLPSISQSEELESVIAVADDIVGTVTAWSVKHFSIYVVFTEDMMLKEPFKLFYYNKNKNLSQLDSVFARKHGYPMWSEYDGEEAPDHNKRAGDYIRLDFFVPEETKGVIYTWADVCNIKNNEKPNIVARRLQAVKDGQMGLYLILSVVEGSVLILSKKAFGSYQTSKNIGKALTNNMSCSIMFHCKTAKTMLDCGHCFCEFCLSYDKRDICAICSKPKSDPIRLKLRHGPCPIDLCSSDNIANGITCIPCGCHIFCRSLVNAYDTNGNNLEPLIGLIKWCPYDACRKRLTGFRKTFPLLN